MSIKNQLKPFMENRKDIKGYEGVYVIDKSGDVISLSRNVFFVNKVGNVSIRKTKEKIINGGVVNGYKRVLLKTPTQREYRLVHRLVAFAFIGNTENKPQVNHINGIKNDNRVENLEWCTASENGIHAFKTGLNIPLRGKHDSQSIAVLEYNNEGVLLREFGSLGEAQRFGLPRTCITRVCNGINKNYNGLIYKYK